MYSIWVRLCDLQSVSVMLIPTFPSTADICFHFVSRWFSLFDSFQIARSIILCKGTAGQWATAESVPFESECMESSTACFTCSLYGSQHLVESAMQEINRVDLLNSEAWWSDCLVSQPIAEICMQLKAVFHIRHPLLLTWWMPYDVSLNVQVNGWNIKGLRGTTWPLPRNIRYKDDLSCNGFTQLNYAIKLLQEKYLWRKLGLELYGELEADEKKGNMIQIEE